MTDQPKLQPRDPASKDSWRLIETPADYRWHVFPVRHWYSRSIGAMVVTSVEFGDLYRVRITGTTIVNGGLHPIEPTDETCDQVLADFGMVGAAELVRQTGRLSRRFQIPIKETTP